MARAVLTKLYMDCRFTNPSRHVTWSSVSCPRRLGRWRGRVRCRRFADPLHPRLWETTTKPVDCISLLLLPPYTSLHHPERYHPAGHILRVYQRLSAILPVRMSSSQCFRKLLAQQSSKTARGITRAPVAARSLTSAARPRVQYRALQSQYATSHELCICLSAKLIYAQTILACFPVTAIQHLAQVSRYACIWIAGRDIKH